MKIESTNPTNPTQPKVRNTMNNITEVFGEFAVRIDGKTEIFQSYAEAEVALAAETNQEANNALAEAYCDSEGYEGKNRVGKKNQVMAFLRFQNTYESGDDQTELGQVGQF